MTEYRADVKVCPGCRHRQHACFPDDIPGRVQYGPRVHGLAVYLNAAHFIPLERTFRHDLEAFTSEGGESKAAIRARALTALELLWAVPAERLLVVSHGGLLNSLMHELIGTRQAWFDFSDSGYATLTVSRKSHVVRMTGINLRPHLPESRLSTLRCRNSAKRGRLALTLRCVSEKE